MASEGERRRIGCLPIIGGGILLLIVIGIFKADPSPEDRCNDQSEAYVRSWQFVRESLIAPSSADFPTSTASRVTNIGGCRYLVRGYVDAQNAFGAKLRNFFIVVMEYRRGADNWYRSSPVILEASEFDISNWVPTYLDKYRLEVAAPSTPRVDRASPNRTSAEISSIQEKLSRLGYEVGPVDGIFGSRTRAAIEEYERGKGIPVTGQATQELVERLSLEARDGTAVIQGRPSAGTSKAAEDDAEALAAFKACRDAFERKVTLRVQNFNYSNPRSVSRSGQWDIYYTVEARISGDSDLHLKISCSVDKKTNNAVVNDYTGSLRDAVWRSWRVSATSLGVQGATAIWGGSPKSVGASMRQKNGTASLWRYESGWGWSEVSPTAIIVWGPSR